MSDLFNTPRVTQRTSLEAYEHALKRSTSLRQKLWATLNHYGPMTADQAAAAIPATILAVRPAFTGMANASMIEPTGETRMNQSGKQAMVWRALPRQAWSGAPSRLTAKQKIDLLKQETVRLRRLCVDNDIDWKNGRIV